MANEPKWEETEPLFEETTPVEASDVPSFDDTLPIDSGSTSLAANQQQYSLPVIPSESDSSELLKTLLGTGTGSTLGYGAGKALATPLENIGKKAIAADMGISSKFIEEFGQKKANELADVALKENIYGMFSSPEKQAKTATDLLKSTGEDQASLYKRAAPDASKVSLEDIISNYKQYAPATTGDKSKIAAYEDVLGNLKNYKDYKSGAKIKALGIEGLQNLKKELTDIAYKEGKALTAESTDKTAAAGQAARSVRESIDSKISSIPDVGTEELKTLKEINKKYGQLSDIETALVKDAAKQGAKADDIIGLLKRGTVDVGKRGLFKGLVQGASKIPVLGAVIGGTFGAATGALASEDKTQGAASGFMEGLGDAILGPIAPERVADATFNNSPERQQLLQEYRKKQIEGGVKYVKDIQKQDLKEQYLSKARDVVQIDDMGINNLYSKVQSSSKPAAKVYSGPLEKALNSEPQRRSTIMYGLQQQPAFRQLLKDLEDNSEE